MAELHIGRKLKITLTVFLAVVLLSYLPFAPFVALQESLFSYLGMIWWAILLGFLLGGVIDHFIPEELVAQFLGEKSLISLLYAVVSGFLLSACSHGILALAIQLHKKGASNASVITFLLASPWANLPVTILLFGFFGWQALLFVGTAMLIALLTGALYLLLERFEMIEASPEAAPSEELDGSNLKHFRAQDSFWGVTKGAVSLANMVLWWILIGIIAAAVLGAFVPQEIFMDYLGPSFTGLLITLLVATVIEVCSEGSAPIAFEIYKQVGTMGNPFVFLIAGVGTDYTEIGLLWTNIGKRVALWLPVLTVPQVLLAGYLFNTFL